MSLTHCPLCMALAVLSAVRGFSHALLLWQLLAGGLRAGGNSPASPATVLPGTGLRPSLS